MAKTKEIQISEQDARAKPKKAPTKQSAAVVQSPLSEMERMFDRFWSRGWPSLWRDRHDFLNAGRDWFEWKGVRLPNVDVIDRKAEILVRAELPGIDKKDLSISMTDHLLTIKGQTKTETKQEDGDYHRHEISSTAYARSIELPATVDSDKAQASMKDGVLEISLPKAAASIKRNITVK